MTTERLGSEFLLFACACIWGVLMTYDFGHVDSQWQSAVKRVSCGEVTRTGRQCQHCAVVYLGEKRRYAKTRDSMWLLWRNFNDAYCYPILVFHTEDLDPVHFRRYLSRDMPEEHISLISFHEITFEFPATYDEAAARREGLVFEIRYPQYHHMIAFWFKHLFEHAAANRAEYWWRLDTDSYVYTPIHYDIFGFMKRHDIQYGYRAWAREGGFYAQGLWNFVTKHMEKQQLVPQQPIRRPTAADDSLPQVYNNFEILHIPTFRSKKPFADFRDSVFATNKIYSKRWGDGPLRALQVCLLLSSSKVHNFCDIEYYHQEWFHRTCTHHEDRAEQLLGNSTCDDRESMTVHDWQRRARDFLGNIFGRLFGI